MTTTYGLTAAGWVSKPYAVCLAELKSDLIAAFGSSILVGEASSNFAKLAAIYAMREALLWELGEGIVAAFDPDAASGADLENLMALTGTRKVAAFASDAIVACTGTPNTTLAIGRIMSTVPGGDRFVTQAEVTIAAVSARSNSHAYSAGDRMYTSSGVYHCKVGGTSGTTAPTSTDTTVDINDGNVIWRFLGAGTGAADVHAYSEVEDAIPGLAGTITKIETPVSGWSACANPFDAAVGAPEMSDAAARIKRETLLNHGQASVDAIRATILRVYGVTGCTVIENVTDGTVNSVPPHAICVLVDGGADADIAAAIWTKAAGIATYGTEQVQITDTNGNTQTVYFSRPTNVPIYVAISGTLDPSRFPNDGVARIKAAIAAWRGGRYGIGETVFAPPLLQPIFEAVPGLLNLALPLIKKSANPTVSTPIAMTSSERATFDSANVTVTLTIQTPVS